ncbi:hypothetical protein NX059_009387 [Plenodomus lindquistii]|nr:hypothetical protein NX059_009387 [Plenodomus lindquistii]
MEAPIPRPSGLEAPIVGSTLKRKNSTLQTSMEVFKCKFGKPVAAPEGDRSIVPSKEWTPIYYAIYHQREAALTHFLRTGGSPDDITGIGQSPLCIAVANGNVEIIRILLEAGADVNARTRNGGETAVHIAVKNGRNDIVDLLIAAGSDLELQTDETGETALHYAASKSGSLANIVTLLRTGANYDTLNASGQTPAEVALKANNLHGAVAIINAAHGKRDKLLKEKEMLLKHVQKTQGRFSIGNDLIADIFTAACDPDSTVLIEAIKRDDYSLVEMFLEKGADPDRPSASGEVPIFVAIDCAGPSVIQALVKHNADVSIRHGGLTVLQAAFEGPSAQDEKAMSAIFDALLKRGADASATCPNGKTLLHLAVSAEFGHTRVAYLLINAGVKVNAQDLEGNTSLHLATHSRPCIDILLKHGANPRQVNAKGLTPLLYATTHGDKAREPDLETLVRESDLRATNTHTQTALHLAACNGLEKMIRSLLRARAETTVVDSDKNTALLVAVKHQQWSVVSLLTIPPSVNSWDEDGMSALHHIARSIPNGASTWANIAAAAVPFCERGVSRSMRDRSGATPLIQAVKILPEDGLPVIEALLVQPADRRASWNCVSHEDHKKCDALYYAITLKKAVFVEALLKNGAMFTLQDWTKGTLDSGVPSDKQILNKLAQYEWARRAGSLRRQSGGPDAEAPVFSSVFPVEDVQQMLSMGLQVNALPRSPLGTSLLWAVLRQIPLDPVMSPSYLLDMMKLILDAGANPNVSTARGSRRSPSPQSSQASKESLPLPLQPLTFLLEEIPSIDIQLITLLLTKGATLSTASPFYDGRFPLHSAVKANRIDIVDEFLLQRPDVNCEDKTGRTPIFSACEQGSWEIADALLRRGAYADISDVDKNTVLHAGAIGGNKRIIAALLRAGAKGNAENTKKMTPLACVRDDLDEKEKEKITWMLKDSAEKETRRADLLRQQAEQIAAHEAKMKHRHTEEAEAERRKREEQEKLQKQQEAEALRQKAQEQESAQKSTKLTKPSPLPPTPAAEKSHSMSRFKKPSFFTRSKNVVPPAPPMPKQPSMISIRINTPPFSNKPTFEASTTTVGTDAPLKPLPTPRVDSGVSQKTAVATAKALPALDRNKSTLDGDAKRESGHELKDWLALSKMIDNL